VNLRDEVTMRKASGEPFPSPPFPAPDDPALRFIINNAIASYRDGSATVEQVIGHVAVHAWYEGHLFAVDGPVDPAVFTAPSG
jgi:hypothetical protein